jgi:putative endonuclease
MFTVYVLYSISFKKIYIGFTSNLKAGLESHNSLAKKGYTVKFGPWIILYTEEFSTKSEALVREKNLKQGIGGKLLAS